MSEPQLQRDEGLFAPLKHLAGAKPLAPHWFRVALAQTPERIRITVAGAGIEALFWGPRGAPGLLFVHGYGGHADWWVHIAPLFAETHRVAAFSLSGMGGSDWRDTYSIETYVDEIFAVAETGGLFEATAKPILAGHSFGSLAVLRASQRRARDLSAIIAVDTPIRPPEEEGTPSPSASPATFPKVARIYPTLTQALARFHFIPPQRCENLFIVDHLARAALKEIAGTPGTPHGWTWRFDPALRMAESRAGRPKLLEGLNCPMALISGAKSNVTTRAHARYILSLAPRGTPWIEIPEADHQVMVDQPIAFVSVLRALLAGWVPFE